MQFGVVKYQLQIAMFLDNISKERKHERELYLPFTNC